MLNVPLLVLQIYLRQLAAAQYRFGIGNLTALLPAVINIVGNLGLYLAGHLSVTSAIVTWLVGQALGTLWLAWYVHSRLEGFGRPNLPLARRSLRFGIRAHTSHTMNLGNYRADQWLMGILSTPQQLGLYSVAVAWAEALFLLPQALMQVQRPDLARSEHHHAGPRAALAFRLSILLTLVLCVAMLVAAPFLCVTVFGEDFRGRHLRPADRRPRRLRDRRPEAAGLGPDRAGAAAAREPRGRRHLRHRAGAGLRPDPLARRRRGRDRLRGRLQRRRPGDGGDLLPDPEGAGPRDCCRTAADRCAKPSPSPRDCAADLAAALKRQPAASPGPRLGEPPARNSIARPRLALQRHPRDPLEAGGDQRARAPWPRRGRCAARPRRRPRRRRRGPGSPPPPSASGTPPTSVATTGSRAAKASNSTCGTPSVQETCSSAWLRR